MNDTNQLNQRIHPTPILIAEKSSDVIPVLVTGIHLAAQVISRVSSFLPEPLATLLLRDGSRH